MSLLRKMWFGTKQFSRWIKVQSPDSTPGMVGSSERLDFGNGGVAIRESVNGHMEYAFTWNRLTQREAREITDFAYGLYGSDLLYVSEPSAIRQNVLNKGWSAPGLTAKDGIPLAGDARPEIVKNFDQSQDYPVDMAKYQITGATARRSFYVPIPPGHTAWVGAHGDASSTSGISVQPTVRGVASGAPSTLPVLGVNTPQRFNGSFSAGADQAGIELSLQAAGAVTNLAVAPSFELGSVTPIVARTNGCVNPKPSSAASVAGWTSSAGGTTVTAFGYTTTNAALVTAYIFSAARAGGVVAGRIYAISAKIRATPSAGVTSYNIRPHKNSGNVYYTPDGGSIGVPADGAVYNVQFYWTATVDIPEGEFFNLSAVANGAGAVGHELSMDEVLLEEVPLKPPVFPKFFYGGGASPDPDMTAAWVSTVGNSASNLTAIQPAGHSPSNSISLVRSAAWASEGDFSGRLIPKTSGSDTYTILRVLSAADAGKTYRAILSIRMTSPTVADNAFARSFFYTGTGGNQQGPKAPNVAGVQQLEWKFSTPANLTSGTLRFYHGGVFGDSDIWIDGFALIDDATGYAGPAFTGRTAGAVWDGTPDNSTSTLTNRFTTLSGVMVQVLPTGETPENGPYISGQGAGGLEFEGRVQAVPYSLAHDSVGLAVKLVETEEWK